MCTFKRYFSDLFFAFLGSKPEIECLVSPYNSWNKLKLEREVLHVTENYLAVHDSVLSLPEFNPDQGIKIPQSVWHGPNKQTK